LGFDPLHLEVLTPNYSSLGSERCFQHGVKVARQSIFGDLTSPKSKKKLNCNEPVAGCSRNDAFCTFTMVGDKVANFLHRFPAFAAVAREQEKPG
jgi:hypothetical protein